MTNNDFSLVSHADYFRQLAIEIDKTVSSDRVALATMTFDSETPLMKDMIRALDDAAHRGVHVSLAVDANAFLMSVDTQLPGPAWFDTNLDRKIRSPYNQWLQALKQLERSGVHYAITNMPHRPFSLMISGRSHIKCAVINNAVYLGGCNLHSVSEVDLMVRFENEQAASWLYGWIENIIAAKGTKIFKATDQKLDIDDTTSIFLDAGVKHQSLIYETALQMIDDAREYVFITCQFFPGGATGQHLKAAHNKGVHVEVLFNHPIKHKKLAPIHYLYNLRERTRLPAAFFTSSVPADIYLHSKVIATEKGVLVGSHNYVTPGVSLGTAEIALRRYDPTLAMQIKTFVKQQLGLE